VPLAPPGPLPLRSERPVLEATQLSYRYPGASGPVLERAAISVGRGDRVLITGPSGAGKSTLAALLALVRTPASGSLLLGGYDSHTLGVAGWRRRVVLVPQFHENHVMTGTLAF